MQITGDYIGAVLDYLMYGDDAVLDFLFGVAYWAPFWWIAFKFKNFFEERRKDETALYGFVLIILLGPPAIMILIMLARA